MCLLSAGCKSLGRASVSQSTAYVWYSVKSNYEAEICKIENPFLN